MESGLCDIRPDSLGKGRSTDIDILGQSKWKALALSEMMKIMQTLHHI